MIPPCLRVCRQRQDSAKRVRPNRDAASAMKEIRNRKPTARQCKEIELAIDELKPPKPVQEAAR